MLTWAHRIAKSCHRHFKDWQTCPYSKCNWKFFQFVSVPPAYEQKTNPKIRNKKTKSGRNFALLDPVFGIQNEKWVLCIKFPPSERFTSSLLTPKTLRAQLPSRSQCALNHSQTALSQSRRWKTEGLGVQDFLEKANIDMTLRQSGSLTVETDGDLLIEAAALTLWGEPVKPPTTNTNSSLAERFKG